MIGGVNAAKFNVNNYCKIVEMLKRIARGDQQNYKRTTVVCV